MARRRFIFFDVGNTLLFPNRTRMLAPLPSDQHPTLDRWRALERRTKQEFDAGMMGGKVDHGFWWTFHTYLLQELNSLDDTLRDQIVENTQNSANWDQIPPGTRDALERIRQHYAIAVISNADGKIDAVLRRCGIADCFASITDSGIVGHEKPHPAIFEAALREMKAQPPKAFTSVTCILSIMSVQPGQACKPSYLTWPEPIASRSFHAWNRSHSWKPGCKTKYWDNFSPNTNRSVVSQSVVILSGAVLQAKRRISHLSAVVREPPRSELASQQG